MLDNSRKMQFYPHKMSVGKSLILCKTLKGAKLRWEPICGNLHKNLADLLQGILCKCGRMPAKHAGSHPEMANHLLHLGLEVKRAKTE